MDRNRAEGRFCWKISAELKSFKFRMMQMSKQEIYDHAYEKWMDTVSSQEHELEQAVENVMSDMKEKIA